MSQNFSVLIVRGCMLLNRVWFQDFLFIHVHISYLIPHSYWVDIGDSVCLNKIIRVDQTVKLTIHLHLLQTLRICGTAPALSHNMFAAWYFGYIDRFPILIKLHSLPSVDFVIMMFLAQVECMYCFQKVAIQSSEKPELLKTRLSMWQAVIRSRFSDARINARKMALEQLCQILTVFVNQLGVTCVRSAESNILPVLKLLLAIARNSLVSSETFVICLRFEVLYFCRFRSSRVWCCAVGCVVPSVSQEYCALKVGTIHPVTQHYIPKDTNSVITNHWWNRNLLQSTNTQFYRRQNKFDQPSVDQHLSMVCFYIKIRTSNF